MLIFVIVIVILILIVGLFTYFLTVKPKINLIEISQISNKELVIRSPVLTPGGLFIHWVLYDIPSFINSISENVPKKEVIEGVCKQGINDFGHVGYGGPCPLPGSRHRYIFVVLTLDVKPNLPPGMSLSKVLEEVHEHILAYGELMVYYIR